MARAKTILWVVVGGVWLVLVALVAVSVVYVMVDRLGSPRAVRSPPTCEERVESGELRGLRHVDVARLQREIDAAETVDDITAAMAPLAQEYGFEVSTDAGRKGNRSWDGVAADQAAEYRRSAKRFVDEIAKYPADWFRSTGIDSFIITSEIRPKDKDIRGVTDQRMLQESFDEGRPITRVRVVVRFGAIRGSIHHELFHGYEYAHLEAPFLFEAARTEFTGPGWEYPDYTNADWIQLNPDGFTYGGTGKAADDINEWHPAPGLITTYAGTNESEDRAEVYGALFATCEYLLLTELMEEDAYLRAKVAYLRDLLRKDHPGFTDDYFDGIHSCCGTPPGPGSPSR